MYTYFAAALMGAQWVQPTSSKDYVDITNLPAFDKENDTAARGDDGLPYEGAALKSFKRRTYARQLVAKHT